MKKTRRCLTAIVSIILSILFIMPPVAKAESSAVALDINSDGEYNTRDIIHLFYNIYFPHVYSVERDWDINNDGETSDKDVIYLLFNRFFPEQYKIINQNYSWHQCPEIVNNYLNNVVYSESDYTVSYIADYAPKDASLKTIRPIGFNINGIIKYNYIPGVENTYDINGVTGSLKPLDKLRWIKTSAYNVRDLGGWKCDGGTIKYGMLVRGGQVSVYDREFLVDEVGIKAHIDLRGSNYGKTYDSSPLGDDVSFKMLTNANQYYLWYSNVFRKEYETYIADTLRYIMSNVSSGKTTYFNCTSGADRTGTTACILEAILGMAPGDIDKDYELTCFYTNETGAAIRHRNAETWRSLIKGINKYEGETFRDKAITYVKSLGITAEEINAFRAAMTDGNPEIIE